MRAQLAMRNKLTKEKKKTRSDVDFLNLIKGESQGGGRWLADLQSNLGSTIGTQCNNAGGIAWYFPSHFVLALPLYEPTQQKCIGCTNKSGFPPVEPYITTLFHFNPIADGQFSTLQESGFDTQTFHKLKLMVESWRKLKHHLVYNIELTTL